MTVQHCRMIACVILIWNCLYKTVFNSIYCILDGNGNGNFMLEITSEKVLDMWVRCNHTTATQSTTLKNDLSFNRMITCAPAHVSYMLWFSQWLNTGQAVQKCQRISNIILSMYSIVCDNFILFFTVLHYEGNYNL